MNETLDNDIMDTTPAIQQILVVDSIASMERVLLKIAREVGLPEFLNENDAGEHWDATTRGKFESNCEYLINNTLHGDYHRLSIEEQVCYFVTDFFEAYPEIFQDFRCHVTLRNHLCIVSIAWRYV